MLPITITVEINEAMIQQIIDKKDYTWTTIEEKIANRAIDSAVHELKVKALQEYIDMYSYNHEKFKELATKTIEEKLWSVIDTHLEKMIEKKWWESVLELKIDNMLRNKMENKLTEYTESILSSLMVINTNQIGNE